MAPETDAISSYLESSLASGSCTSGLQSKLKSTAKRALLTTIDYEAAGSDQQRHLGGLRRKYTVLSVSTATQHSTDAGNDAVCTTATNISPPEVAAGLKGSRRLSAELPRACWQLSRPSQLSVGWPTAASAGMRRQYAVGSGLVNLGNSCYLNSSLQALFHIPAMVRYLLESAEHSHNTNNNSKNNGSTDKCIYCAVLRTLRQTQTWRAGGAVKPTAVYSQLKLICRELTHGRQEDAHEFVRHLLEAMQRSDLAWRGWPPPPGQSPRATTHTDPLVAGTVHKMAPLVKETAPLSRIFGGYLRNQVTCLRCRHVSITFQHFQDLPVDIRQAGSVDEALQRYFGREKLGDNDYRCERCSQRVPATKKFSIAQPPLVLCIQLKRFGNGGGKLNKRVLFANSLNVARFLSSSIVTASTVNHSTSLHNTPSSSSSLSAQPVLYSLTSLVSHCGSSRHCGHYTATARAADGQLYVFDDCSVRATSLQAMLSTSAYLLFYEMTPGTKQRLYGNVNSNGTLVDIDTATRLGAKPTANICPTTSSQSPPNQQFTLASNSLTGGVSSVHGNMARTVSQHASSRPIETKPLAIHKTDTFNSGQTGVSVITVETCSSAGSQSPVIRRQRPPISASHSSNMAVATSQQPHRLVPYQIDDDEEDDEQDGGDDDGGDTCSSTDTWTVTDLQPSSTKVKRLCAGDRVIRSRPPVELSSTSTSSSSEHGSVQSVSDEHHMSTLKQRKRPFSWVQRSCKHVTSLQSHLHSKHDHKQQQVDLVLQEDGIAGDKRRRCDASARVAELSQHSSSTPRCAAKLAVERSGLSATSSCNTEPRCNQSASVSTIGRDHATSSAVKLATCNEHEMCQSPSSSEQKGSLDRLLASGRGLFSFGHSVRSWNGEYSSVDRDHDMRSNKSLARSDVDLYNEGLDAGRLKKCRRNGAGARHTKPAAGLNLFQRLEERRRKHKRHSDTQSV